MMNKVFGGTVHKKSVREDGVFNIVLDNTCSLFRYCRNFLYIEYVKYSNIIVAKILVQRLLIL